MAKKKRRRSKSKNKHQDEGYFDAEENQALAKGTSVIDDHVLRLIRHLNLRIKRSLFKDYGYQCTKCEWATKKTGINGRNAVRAHSKKHKNEQRALNHLRTQLWVGFGLLLAILLTSVWSLIAPAVPDIPTSWATTSTLIGMVLATTSFFSAYLLVNFQSLYSHDLRKHWSHGYLLALTAGVLVLIAEALLVSGPIPADVATPWLLSGALPVAALAYTRTGFGKAKLRASRRERRSTNYVRRYIARTSDGDAEYDVLSVKVKHLIRLKRFVPNYSKPWQWKALNAIDVKVPKRKVPTKK
jgi:cation transport ATPase